mgnify:CR=1 FL=1
MPTIVPRTVFRQLARNAALQCSILLIMMLIVPGVHAETEMSAWPQVTLSKDGTPISYEVHGSGEPTLLFVHGWSCDGRYWRHQVERFAHVPPQLEMDNRAVCSKDSEGAELFC